MVLSLAAVQGENPAGVEGSGQDQAHPRFRPCGLDEHGPRAITEEVTRALKPPERNLLGRSSLARTLLDLKREFFALRQEPGFSCYRTLDLSCPDDASAFSERFLRPF